MSDVPETDILYLVLAGYKLKIAAAAVLEVQRKLAMLQHMFQGPHPAAGDLVQHTAVVGEVVSLIVELGSTGEQLVGAGAEVVVDAAAAAAASAVAV